MLPYCGKKNSSTVLLLMLISNLAIGSLQNFDAGGQILLLSFILEMFLNVPFYLYEEYIKLY